VTLTDPDLVSGRLFFGLPVPSSARGPLEAVVPELERLMPKATFTLPAGWHLTFAFLGQVRPERTDQVVEAGERVAAAGRPLSLRLAGAGVFPDLGPARVLWAGLAGDVEAAEAISSELGAACRAVGLLQEDRPFRGHLTLARLGKPAAVPAEALGLAAEAADGCPAWEARELCCFRSQVSRRGARYEVVRRFRLGAPAGAGR